MQVFYQDKFWAHLAIILRLLLMLALQAAGPRTQTLVEWATMPLASENLKLFQIYIVYIWINVTVKPKLMMFKNNGLFYFLGYVKIIASFFGRTRS